VVAAGNAVLTISADGRSTRTPDLAVFNAGVTTQAKTAAAALTENAERMNAVIAALKASGIAERDIQTSGLSVNPVYGQPRADENGNVSGEPVDHGLSDLEPSVEVRASARSAIMAKPSTRW